MSNEPEIIFYKSESKGKGLPYGIIETDVLFASNDIFTPSLRDFHVIFWFKKGTGTYYVDFQEYHFKPNTVVLLSKDQVHYFKPMVREKVEIQSIVFNPEFIYRNDGDLQHLFQFTVANHIKGVQIVQVSGEATELLEQFSMNMKMVYDNWSYKARQHAFYHWLSLFLIHIEQMQTHPTDSKNDVIDEQSKLLLSFNQLLETNFRNEYKVEFYLGQLGVTVKALSKVTKKRYKLSPKAVIDERRVLEIKRQLKGTTLAIKNIAYDLGFDEPTNMVKYFKKHTDQTPLSFREENS